MSLRSLPLACAAVGFLLLGGLAGCGGGGEKKAAPNLTLRTSDPTAMAGEPFTISVEADGADPKTYQWYVDDFPVPGKTRPAYPFDVRAAHDKARFRVEVKNPYGVTSSEDFVLSVKERPVIKFQEYLHGDDVEVGQNAAFHVNARGSSPLMYRWLLNGAEIKAANDPSYTTGALRKEGTFKYTVEVSNAFGGASADFTLNVRPLGQARPMILGPPAHQTVEAGQSVTFEVLASGSMPLRYRWKRNGQEIPGVTGHTYTIDKVILADDEARFSVGVYNQTQAKPESESAVLTVGRNHRFSEIKASSFRKGREAVLAADGNPATPWSSELIGKPSNEVQWLEVDLGAELPVARAKFQWASVDHPKVYSLQYLDPKAGVWQEAWNNGGKILGMTIRSFDRVWARKFRILMTAPVQADSHYTLYEFQLFQE